jgi:hypothetical protein
MQPVPCIFVSAASRKLCTVRGLVAEGLRRMACLPILSGPERWGFTQMQYEIALELKLPCYVFRCGKPFPFVAHDPEPEDRQLLQPAHRGGLLKQPPTLTVPAYAVTREN